MSKSFCLGEEQRILWKVACQERRTNCLAITLAPFANTHKLLLETAGDVCV